jgi:hypothetical protein
MNTIERDEKIRAKLDFLNNLSPAQKCTWSIYAMPIVEEISALMAQPAEEVKQAEPVQIVSVCTSLSRAEFHDHAWSLYHAKTLDDPMLRKMCIHSMRALFDAIYDALPKTPSQPDAQTATNQWREAVLAECAISHMSFYEDNPRKTIQDVISWHVQVALDPLVSQTALDSNNRAILQEERASR